MDQVNVRMVDPRQPRLGQAVTGAALLVGFVIDWPPVIPVTGTILAAASLLGPRANLYAYLFRALPLGPPRELEEAAPPRFANTLGFIVLALATIAHYGFDATTVAWSLGLLVAGLALLSAVTGLCAGCELYVISRRLLTGGRVPHRRTAPSQLGAGT